MGLPERCSVAFSLGKAPIGAEASHHTYRKIALASTMEFSILERSVLERSAALAPTTPA